jgi:hypothetical protein
MTSAEELADTFVFSKPRELSGRDPSAVNAEGFAIAIDLPELQEGKEAQKLNAESTTTTLNSIVAAGQSANADVSEMIRDDLKARRIEDLEYELRSTRAINETLKGEVEQLEVALSVAAVSSAQYRTHHQQSCSWFACTPGCDLAVQDPQRSAQALPPLVPSMSSNMSDYNGGVEGSGGSVTTRSA